jgi:iron complex outermembrane recepter protein
VPVKKPIDLGKSKINIIMKRKFLKVFIAALISAFTYSNTLYAQDPAQADFYDMSLEELMNVEITLASKKAESSFDSPLSTTVLSSEEILKSGVTTIEEALKLVPGIIVRQETNGNYDVHLRGNDNVPPGSMTFASENTMTLVMINNRKVYNYANGGVFWESLPISLGDIERIEVVRGPSTALYGPNAVSGVINIVTKKVMDKTVNVTGNMQYGNESTGIYNFAIGSSVLDNNLKLRLSGNYEKRDRFTSDYYAWYYGQYSPTIYDYSGVEEDRAANYPNPTLAKERQGLNAVVDYQINKDINVSVEGGMQNSFAQSVFMETQATPIAGRHSDSYYYNLVSSIHGLDVQLSGNTGTLDIYEGSPSSMYDFNIFDANAEYSIELNKLTLRPGLSYQKAVYTDMPYGGSQGIGYLNAERELSSYAYYLRGDYKATDKLRLIAALRMDQYNVPDKGYLTYQLIGTYKIDDSNILRAGYSRANRGAFMIDSYSNYSMNGGAIQFYGNENLDLATMDMMEVGYRVKAAKNLSFDLELFQTKTEDLTAFVGDLSTLPVVSFPYQNLSVVSIQTGASVNVNWVISPKYQVRAWGTFVDSKLKDLAVMQPTGLDLDPSNPGPEAIVITDMGLKQDIANPQTPKWYGGLSVNASPIAKLNIFTDVYYLGGHTYVQEFDYYAQAYKQMDANFPGSGRTDVASNATVDLKASYQVCKNANVFVNARNLLNNENQQFGFADKMGGLYLVGISFDL